MTMRSIPHAAAMVEFVTDPTDDVRYTGLCGEDAGLALAHVVDPVKWPLNAATLSSIARWEIGKGQASSNGSEPLSSIASWLAAEGIAHTNYGYSQPPSFDWRGMLAQWGGIKPIVFEYANAQALPGDEAGVAYHFNCCLGWDPAANVGLFADGDNLVERDGGTALVKYSLADLVAAGVCGMLVGEYALGGNMATVPSGWTDNGTTLTAPNGLTVGTGFRDWILAHAWDAADTPVAAETHVSEVEYCNTAHGAGTIQYFQQSQLSWTQAAGVWQTRAGLEAHALRAQVDALSTQLTSAQGNLTAAQQQRDALSAQLSAAQSQIATLQQQLATAQAANAQAAQPTAQEQAAMLVVKAIKAALAANAS